jgi:putative tryptophan/tyrosine transport system substrate-binding protein
MIDRRAFIGSFVLATVALPRTAPAQPARKVYRIGILSHSGTASNMVGSQPQAANAKALLRGLRELDYVYGQSFVTEARGAEGKLESVPGLAAELVRLHVDVIVSSGFGLAALKQATSTIPIVMAGAGDPVGDGFAQSLRRPGGNFTGLSEQSVETVGKRLELLKELVPGAAPVAVLRLRAKSLSWAAAEAAARERGWKLLSLEIEDVDGIEAALKAATTARAGSLLVIPSGALFRHARRVAELVARSRLPAMYGFRQYVEAGGLIAYDTDFVEIWRRAAVFVDKILKGANPADLPIEQPSKFALVINLRAAKALGLTIPQSVLLRADEVIQ